jgi:endoglucanase
VRSSPSPSPESSRRKGRWGVFSGALLLAGCVESPHPYGEAALGMNLAGPEFGMEVPGYSNLSPGKLGEDYRFPDNKTVEAFSGLGFRVVRLPLAWERIQPQPGGPIDAAYLSGVLELLDAGQIHGARVVLDLHAYGRYRLGTGTVVQSLTLGVPQGAAGPGLGAEHLANFWLRLADQVHDHPALLALGLMNEPHDMGVGDWHGVSNQVVGELRQAGYEMWLWVAGDNWSKAHEWTAHNPAWPWINDPLGRTAYEAHVYFDADASGRYALSFDEELRADPVAGWRGRERLRPFVEWCERGGATGVIGEFGVPWQDPAWGPVLAGFLAEAESHGLTVCAWAAGEWWGDYALSLQPFAEGDRPLPQPMRAALRP